MLERGQARVGRDPVQPGTQRRTALEPIVGTPRPQIGLLDQVLGIVDRAEHPVAVRQQLAAQRLAEPNELLAVCHRRSPGCHAGAITSTNRDPPSPSNASATASSGRPQQCRTGPSAASGTGPVACSGPSQGNLAPHSSVFCTVSTAARRSVHRSLRPNLRGPPCHPLTAGCWPRRPGRARHRPARAPPAPRRPSGRRRGPGRRAGHRPGRLVRRAPAGGGRAGRGGAAAGGGRGRRAAAGARRPAGGHLAAPRLEPDRRGSAGRTYVRCLVPASDVF